MNATNEHLHILTDIEVGLVSGGSTEETKRLRARAAELGEQLRRDKYEMDKWYRENIVFPSIPLKPIPDLPVVDKIWG